MTPPVTAPSPREARIAGLCYLAVIAGGVFAALFVRDRLIVGGDAPLLSWLRASWGSCRWASGSP